jgi:hypothetical protein
LLKNTLFALRQAQGERKIYCERRGFPFVVSLSSHKHGFFSKLLITEPGIGAQR